ncbi:MAG TPA: RDD family protein [Anaerolineales bacterium]
MKIYAGLWQRVGAFVLDYGIILVYLVAIALFSLLMNSLFSVNQWLFTDRIRAQLSGFLFITLPVTLYFAFSESSIRQASWGKQRLGLKVTDHNGDRIGLRRSFARTGLKFVPWELAHTLIWQISFTPNQFSQWIIAGFVTVYFLIGANIASLIFRKARQTLYDLLAGTYVVKI